MKLVLYIVVFLLSLQVLSSHSPLSLHFLPKKLNLLSVNEKT